MGRRTSQAKHAVHTPGRADSHSLGLRVEQFAEPLNGDVIHLVLMGLHSTQESRVKDLISPVLTGSEPHPSAVCSPVEVTTPRQRGKSDTALIEEVLWGWTGFGCPIASPGSHCFSFFSN